MSNAIKRICFIKDRYIKSPSPRLKKKGPTVSCKEKMLFGAGLILAEIIKTHISIFIKDLIISDIITLKQLLDKEEMPDLGGVRVNQVGINL